MKMYKVVFAEGKTKADICDAPICKDLQNKIVPNPVKKQFVFFTEAVNEEAAKNYFKFAFMIFLRERGLVI